MIVAVMQPYLLPYIGYFQLMHAVDTFVVYDNAQYMKGGWINRNRIVHGKKLIWMTLPVVRASHSLHINQRTYLLKEGVPAIRQQLEAAYRSSAFFSDVYPRLTRLLDFTDPNVAAFNSHILRALAADLGLKCRFLASSELDIPAETKGTERVLAICKCLAASEYVNPIGGMDLYQTRDFLEAGIKLRFLRTTANTAPDLPVGTHLSIVDGLMREGFRQWSERLNQYELVSHP